MQSENFFEGNSIVGALFARLAGEGVNHKGGAQINYLAFFFLKKRMKRKEIGPRLEPVFESTNGVQ